MKECEAIFHGRRRRNPHGSIMGCLSATFHLGKEANRLLVAANLNGFMWCVSVPWWMNPFLFFFGLSVWLKQSISGNHCTFCQSDCCSRPLTNFERADDCCVLVVEGARKWQFWPKLMGDCKQRATWTVLVGISKKFWIFQHLAEVQRS